MKRQFIFILSLFFFFLLTNTSWAIWVWTPETNKWANPKYSVKEDPQKQLDYALSFLEAKDYKEAIKEFQKLIKHYPRARQAPEAQYYIGQCLEAQGELFKAFKEYQTVIDKYPFSERSAEIVKKEYEIGEKLVEGKEKNKIIEVFAGSDYDVIEVFKTVIKNAPYGELAPPAQYKIGLYLLENNLLEEARDAFDKVVNDYPNSEWVKAAKYQIAIVDAKRSTGVQYDQAITKEAVQEFKDFLTEYPDAQLSEEAKEKVRTLQDKEAENNYRVAEFYEKQKNYTSAKFYYQIIVDEYKTSRWAPKALLKIREMARKEEQAK